MSYKPNSEFTHKQLYTFAHPELPAGKKAEMLAMYLNMPIEKTAKAMQWVSRHLAEHNKDQPHFERLTSLIE